MSVTFDAGTSSWNETFQANVLSSTSPEEIGVNMSNSNAHRVAQTLGIDLDPDWCGDMAAEDFLGRVLMALAISPADEGMPSHTLQPGDDAGVLFGTVREGGPTIIAGARRPGYLQERLAELHELALWAVANDAVVMWG